MTRLSLPDHFSALADPRQHGKVLYPLPEIMLLILCRGNPPIFNGVHS